MKGILRYKGDDSAVATSIFRTSFLPTRTLSSRHGHNDSQLSEWQHVFDERKKQPFSWYVPARFVLEMWSYVSSDLEQYSASHFRNQEFKHVCLAPECTWHHAENPSSHREGSRLEMLSPDMHLVVQRYIKPWTRNFEDAGMALLYQAGRVSLHRQDYARLSVFISHCWGEKFKLFANTIKNSLDPETTIWVCSFGIWQHGNVSGQLISLESCPFAIALASSERVVVVTDQSVEALSRCWCVLEAVFALKWHKPYDVCIEENTIMLSWSQVLSTLARHDLQDCFATYQEDKNAIIAYAQACEGGIDGLNKIVRQVFLRASERARLSAAVAKGDVQILDEADANTLQALRDVRGRGVLHLAALEGQLASMMYIGRNLAWMDLDLPDHEGKSPLCVASEAGAVAGVQGLLALQADVEGAHAIHGLKPLHYAALAGSAKIVLMLAQSRANCKAACTHGSHLGQQPLHLAAKGGRAEVTRLLIHYRADWGASGTSGRTVLWQAVHAGHTGVVAALIAAKVDTNQLNSDKFKRAPIVAAIKHDSVELVSMLLGASAHVSYTDGSKMQCVDYCTPSGTPEAEWILREIWKRTRSHSRCSCVLS